MTLTDFKAPCRFEADLSYVRLLVSYLEDVLRE